MTEMKILWQGEEDKRGGKRGRPYDCEVACPSLSRT